MTISPLTSSFKVELPSVWGKELKAILPTLVFLAAATVAGLVLAKARFPQMKVGKLEILTQALRSDERWALFLGFSFLTLVYPIGYTLFNRFSEGRNLRAVGKALAIGNLNEAQQLFQKGVPLGEETLSMVLQTSDLLPVLLETGRFYLNSFQLKELAERALEQERFGSLEALVKRGGMPKHPLHALSAKNWLQKEKMKQLVELFLLHGVAVDGVDEERQTALHVACTHLNLVAAELLLRSGANPGSLDRRHETPIGPVKESSHAPWDKASRTFMRGYEEILARLNAERSS